MSNRAVWPCLLVLTACGPEQGGVPAGDEPLGVEASSGALVTAGATSAGGAGGAGISASGGSASGSGGAGGLDDALPCDVDGTPGLCLHVADCGGGDVPVPGHCPGPAEVQCCIPEPTEGSCVPGAMVSQPVALVEVPGVGGCPAGMLRVASFCIDRYEAALVRVADGAPWSPYFNPGDEPVRAVSVEGAVPQGYIDQVGAAAACLASGKRLCTDVEWLRACRGAANHVYPYGEQPILGVCNDHRTVHPAVEYFGTTEPWIYSEIDHECLNQLPDSLDPCGANVACKSEDGVFDMVGNLHEWTADPAGTFRGGFYVDTVKNGSGCLYATTAHDVFHWDYSTGFRCCANP
ncbi:MAG: SUMF1/EgtB/PvdO family nonheme iron enzyme [Deltaproteobacteria bacterium]|nr:SUMF1/EgtB/PvdO family nonheme iron enzyme [Deltaproteobacteria bacterium]